MFAAFSYSRKAIIMDNFKAIYKILRLLERSMDCCELDEGAFAAERFKVTEEHWLRLLEMLSFEGYIDGISLHRGAAAKSPWR